MQCCIEISCYTAVATVRVLRLITISTTLAKEDLQERRLCRRCVAESFGSLAVVTSGLVNGYSAWSVDMHTLAKLGRGVL